MHRGILRGSPVIIIVYGLHPRISWCQNFSALKRVSIQRRTQREIYQAERGSTGKHAQSIQRNSDFYKENSCRVIIIPRPPVCPLTSTNTVRAYKGLISPIIRLYRIFYCHASRPTDSFQPARFSRSDQSEAAEDLYDQLGLYNLRTPLPIVSSLTRLGP